jgi:hypothetical protein
MTTRNVNFSGGCAFSKHWQYIWRPKGESVAGLIEDRVKVNLQK